MIVWDETRGQDANAYHAAHMGCDLFVYRWHDGYAESHFNFEGRLLLGHSIYTKSMKVPLEQIQKLIVESVENFLKESC